MAERLLRYIHNPWPNFFQQRSLKALWLFLTHICAT